MEKKRLFATFLSFLLIISCAGKVDFCRWHNVWNVWVRQTHISFDTNNQSTIGQVLFAINPAAIGIMPVYLLCIKASNAGPA